MDVTSNAIKATLLVGDSFPARLDKERLGKKKEGGYQYGKRWEQNPGCCPYCKGI